MCTNELRARRARIWSGIVRVRMQFMHAFGVNANIEIIFAKWNECLGRKFWHNIVTCDIYRFNYDSIKTMKKVSKSK